MSVATSRPPAAPPRAGEPLAALAGLLADPTRASICLALLDGRAWTAGELARIAGVAPSTASGQLGRLIAGGLLVEQRQGRYRYLRLASPRVAQLIEDFASYARPVPPARSLRAARTSEAMARARTCYDHLAGRLGVLVLDALTQRGFLDRTAGLALTGPGARWLTELGIDVPALASASRPLLRECLDWTERRSHLAGGAGAALCLRFVDNGWVRRDRESRAVRISATGAAAFAELLGIEPADLDPGAEAWGGPRAGSGAS